VLIFDDTIQEKAWTDENELMCWHFDHCSGRTVRGINLLNALYYGNGTSFPVAFEVVVNQVIKVLSHGMVIGVKNRGFEIFPDLTTECAVWRPELGNLPDLFPHDISCRLDWHY
jgi:hypothetical protein